MIAKITFVKMVTELGSHAQHELTQVTPTTLPREIDIPCFYEISVKKGTQSRDLRRNATKLEQLVPSGNTV